MLGLSLLSAPVPAHDESLLLAPHPEQTDAFTAWMFEAHGCEMTEDELFAAYQRAGTGLLGASRAVIALSTRSDVLRREGVPPVYRFYGSRACRRAAAGGAQPPQGS